jgi:7-cyano-7-deazaguanine synthase
MKEALVLLSGGMDSAVALGAMCEMFSNDKVMAVSFDYGSKHNDREYRAAQDLAAYYDVLHRRISLPMISELFVSDLLKSSKGSIPDGHYTDASMSRTVVPFRNGIMLSIAAGLAESYECSSVVLANHAGDHAIYADCRPQFTKAMNDAIKAGTDRKVHLLSPFCLMTKTEIARYGAEHGVPLHLTYSCYNGRELHCGTCGTCTERKEAFADSNQIDPTKYEA